MNGQTGGIGMGIEVKDYYIDKIVEELKKKNIVALKVIYRFVIKMK